MVLDPPGADISQRPETDLRRFLLERNTNAAATKVTVAGDYCRHQAGFFYEGDALTLRDRSLNTGSDFLQAWKYERAELEQYYDDGGNFTTDDDLVKQFHERHDRDGEEFPDYVDCFRKFALNETGEYGTADYNGGTAREAYDFEPVFGHSDYQIRHRRFERTIERPPDAAGRVYFQPKLKITYDGGDIWTWCEDFRLEKSECAIYITVPDLTKLQRIENGEAAEGPNFITALYQGTLQFILIACVADDTRTGFAAEPTLTGATRFVVEQTVIDPEAYPKAQIIARRRK